MNDSHPSRVPLETLATRYWAATLPLLVGAPVTGTAGYLLVTALVVAQWIHFAWREGAATAFAAQVRAAYLLLIALSLLPWLQWILWAVFAGTTIRVTFNYCFLARVMSLMPWIRTEPLSWARLQRTFLTPPKSGSILHRLAPGTQTAAP